MEKMWGETQVGGRQVEGVRWTGREVRVEEVEGEDPTSYFLSGTVPPSSSLFLSLFLSPSLSLSQIKNALLARCTVHVYSAHVQPRLIKKRKEF